MAALGLKGASNLPGQTGKRSLQTQTELGTKQSASAVPFCLTETSNPAPSERELTQDTKHRAGSFGMKCRHAVEASGQGSSWLNTSAHEHTNTWVVFSLPLL